MAQTTPQIDVYLEIGKKRAFAGALDWPGWCRSGRDEDTALQALLNYGPRYGNVLNATQLKFHAPADLSAFNMVERLEGDTTTDFGAPSVAPTGDSALVNEAELNRFQTILEAGWQAFDAAATAAVGKELRKGPRGGGRNLESIIQHLLGSDRGYLAQLGWQLKQGKKQNIQAEQSQTREAILQALTAAVADELPAVGPRGGIRWTPRYFVRRLTWHLFDHLWEIEDRVM